MEVLGRCGMEVVGQLHDGDGGRMTVKSFTSLAIIIRVMGSKWEVRYRS